MLKKRFTALALTLALALPLVPSAAAAAVPTEGLRGVWVPTVMSLDYPSAAGENVAALERDADTILDNAAAMGLNAVFLQVRPCADALYESDLFPWSRYLTGTQGAAPAEGFDPLEYWITEAHARGLQLHAWINPYRITKNGASDFETLSADSPARQNPDWVVEYNDNYYFDPALPGVQQLVVDGAAEIVRNYDVDGIHLDDYFYPGTDFDDAASYAKYGAGKSKADWRRKNVNTLIAALDKKLHVLDPDLSFGISPFGIWDNRSANPRGSNTAGQSSYAQLYCDTLAWIDAGTVDYICPQLYWSIGYEIADFSVLLNWWTDAVRGSDVALYIGMGAYRMEDAKPGDTFYGTAELQRQLDLLSTNPAVSGVCFYRYSSFLTVSGAQAFLTDYYQTPHEVPQQNDRTEQAALRLSEVFSRFLSALYH